MKELFIILLISSIAFSKDKYDSLFIEINKKQIIEMTDGEYRYFRDYIDDNDIDFECVNDKIDNIRPKRIADMNNNEFDYFSDQIFECDTVKPCVLMQFLEIKDKKEIEMTNSEYDFRQYCERECSGYLERHPETKSGKLKRNIRRIFLFAVLPAAIIGICIVAIYMTEPTGPE